MLQSPAARPWSRRWSCRQRRDERLRTLAYRVERRELGKQRAPNAFWSVSAARTAVSMASRSSAMDPARPRGCIRGALWPRTDRIARVSWFWSACRSCRAENIAPAISSIADSLETKAFSLDRAKAPSAIVIGRPLALQPGLTRPAAPARTAVPAHQRPNHRNDDVVVDLDGHHDQRGADRECDQESFSLKHRLV